MTVFGGTYSTGSAIFLNGSVTVHGLGVMWNTIEQGDYIYSQGVLGLIDSVDTNNYDTITLMKPWQGASFSADPEYVILKMSWARYDPAITQQKVRQLIALLEGAGITYYVTDTEPDPDIGNDGDFALKTNSGAWKFWVKIDGAWVLQGTPVGATWQGPWAISHPYVLNDVVSYLGSTYIALQAGINRPPTANLDTYWQLFVSAGSRYDFLIWDTGRPSTAELLINAILTVTVAFPAGLSESRAKSVVAATASAQFLLKKNGAQFGTVTFAPSSTVGVVTSPTDTTFVAGDVLSVIAPDPRDATLEGVSMTITGYR